MHIFTGTVQVSGLQSIAGGPLTFLRSDYNGSAAVQINFLNINPSNGFDSDLGIQLMNTGGSMVDVLRIKGSTGNVGIGTTSPSVKLTVSGDVTDSDVGQFRAVGSTSAAKMINVGYHTTNNYGFISALIAGTGYSALSLQPNGGNVGIGTTSPGCKFAVIGETQISSSSAYTTHLNYNDAGTNFITTANTGYTYFRGSSNNVTTMAVYGGGGVSVGTGSLESGCILTVRASNSARMSVTDGTTRAHFWPTGGAFYISTETNSPMVFITNAGERMRIATDGNVGIGTTSPAYKLEVASGTSGQQSLVNFRTADSTTANNAGIQIFATPSATATSREAVMALDADGANASGGDYFLIKKRGNSGTTDFEQYSNASMRFGTNFISRATYDMTIANDGNVGIGTTNPATKLAVNGVSSFGLSSKLSMIGLDINSGETPTYVKIITTIPVVSYAADFTVNIKGFIYGASRNADISISWHYYLSTFYNPIAKSSGGWAPTIRLSAEGGFVAIVLSSPGYWPKFYVESMYSSAYNNQYVSGWSWVDADATGSPIVNVPYASNFGNGFVMLTDGNVGIGTTSPNAKLDVNGTSNFAANVYHSIGGQKFFAGSGGTYAYIYTGTTALNFINGNDTSTLMTLLNGGNVGIGTTSPNAKLDVNGSIYLIGNIRNAWGDNLFNVAQYPDNTSTSPGYYMGFQTDANNRIFYISNKNEDGSATDPNGGIIFRTGGTPTNRMLISYTGNVGIGTTSPGYKLQVNSGGIAYLAAQGNALVMGDDATYGASGTGRYVALGYGGLSNGANKIFAHNTGQDGLYICSATSRNIAFRAGGGATDQVVIKSDGNVGIGETSPSSKFVVNNNGGVGSAFYVDVGNRNDVTTLFEHTGANTPVPFRLKKSGYSGTGATYGILYLQMNDGTVGNGSNLYFTANDSAGNEHEYGGLGAHIITNTNGAESGDLVFYTSDAGTIRSEKVRIKFNGNVGIATTSPSAKLHVNDFFISKTLWGDASAHSYWGNYSTAYGRLTWDTGLAWINATSGNVLHLGANGSNKHITIDTNGSVGIGTSSPSVNLHVVSSNNTTIKTKGGTENNQGSSYYVEKAFSTATLTAYGDTASITGGFPDTSVSIWTAGQVPLLFQIGGSEKVRITSTGSVGIGTSSPTQKLEVNGTIKATSFVGSFSKTSTTQTITGNSALTIDVSAAYIHIITVAASGGVFGISSVTYNNRKAGPEVDEIILIFKWPASGSGVITISNTIGDIPFNYGKATVSRLTSYKGTTGLWIAETVASNIDYTNL